MWEQYYTPSNLDQALELLAKKAPEARLVAGATDLMLELESGVRPEVKALIDITRVTGLDQITEDAEGWIRLGPLVTHNQCAGSALIREHAYALAQACWEVGAPQIRNRGTVAGNLITASPANDSIPVLIALDAVVTLQSAHSERDLPLTEFYQGVRKTVMEPDEILTEIRFLKGSAHRESAFFKLGLRRAQAISVVNAAAALELKEGVVHSASIALGSVAPVVVRASEAEAFLVGKELDSKTLEEAARLAERAATPISDLRGSAKYRSHMVKVCVKRALKAIQDAGDRTGLPEDPVMLWGADYHLPPAPSKDIILHEPGEPIETRINGKVIRFDQGHEKSLLRLLREDAGLIGTKEGCAEGECGACTVFLDGMAVMACLVPAPRAHGADIVTVEGLEQAGSLHPIQEAFIDEGAVQCGYCTPGFIMSGVKLLEEKPQPSRSDISQAFTGNLCRCTGYYKIIQAVEKAAATDGIDSK
jgi:carbon-monoxide dehydrogenase medium subunit